MTAENTNASDALDNELSPDAPVAAQAPAEAAMQPQLSMLMDINVDVAIELGNKPMKIRDLLKLQANSVVELNKAAGDALDIKVNGALIGKGEVVIVDGKYGIRLTEVTSQSERLGNLN